MATFKNSSQTPALIEDNLAPADPNLVTRFFEGLDELRAYLNRKIQDPQHRQARLALVAQNLLRPKTAEELGQYLVCEIQAALGASSCQLYLQDPNWHLWQTCKSGPGPSSDARPLAIFSQLANLSSVNDYPGLGQLFALRGTSQTIGAMWLKTPEPIDYGTQKILVAIIDAAGVALENFLKKLPLQNE